jgi:hypothetical protein
MSVLLNPRHRARCFRHVEAGFQPGVFAFAFSAHRRCRPEGRRYVNFQNRHQFPTNQKSHSEVYTPLTYMAFLILSFHLEITRNPLGVAFASFDNWWVFLFAIVFVLVMMALQKVVSGKRTKALTEEAPRLGLAFIGDKWTGEHSAPHLQTALFGRGRGKEFKNIMCGSRDGFRVNLFDYSFVVRSGGRSSTTYYQTVACFSKDSLSLPTFELRPCGIVDKVWDALAHKNIHFDSDPDFSRRYVLRGALEDQVRSLFGPGLLEFAERIAPEEKWHIEGDADTLIVYRLSKKVSPEALQIFLDQTATLASGFLGQVHR